jgi:hypothetical protein
MEDWLAHFGLHIYSVISSTTPSAHKLQLTFFMKCTDFHHLEDALQNFEAVGEHRWQEYMKHHVSLSAEAVLTPLVDQHAKPLAFSSHVPPFLEFLLVFLHFVGGQSYLELAVKYEISVTQVHVIIHNGAFLVSALWVPLYFSPLSPSDIFQHHTPPPLQHHLLTHFGGKPVLCLVSDPKEIMTDHPSSFLQLNTLLFSSKLKKFHSVKFGTFCCPDGFLVW